MGKAKVAIVVFLVVVLFASSLGSVAIYYVNVVSDKDSKISTLQSQISALQSQMSTLESQIAMLQSQIAEATETATIKTALGVVDIPSDKHFRCIQLIIKAMFMSQALFLMQVEQRQ